MIQELVTKHFNLVETIEMDVKSFKEVKIVEKEKIMNM